MSNADSPELLFDGYIAAPEPLEINRVIMVANHRARVVHQFADFNEWNSARTDRTRTKVKEAEPGFFKEGLTRDRLQTKPAPPPRTGYFYGVQWLPEEQAHP